MFKISRKTDGPSTEAKSPIKEELASWVKENKYPIIAVALIMVMAFVMRFVFAYGVSADNAFALSGGTVASEHLHTITEIMSGGSFFGVNDSLNYPFGSVNSNPILIDAILACIANILVLFGMGTVEAASFTLAMFSVFCGTFVVIPMFLLGKEVVGTKKAGYVAAIFIALCPVVITQTVFSNGTETGWTLLLFIVLVLLVFKGLKSIVVSTHTDDPVKEILLSSGSVIRMAAITGLVLALIVLSTSDFRSIVVLLILAMLIMVIIGRFMYRETRTVALYFSIIIAIGMAVAAAYYLPAKLWDEVLSGILILSVASIVICVSFAMLQRQPWIITVPAYLIVVIVALALFSAFVPDFYNDLIHGNSVYADSIAPLMVSSLSISHLSANYGVVTLWVTIPIVGILLWRLPKNISSFRYQFLLVFMIISVYMSSRSDEMAALFSPVYAISFAYLTMWLFDHVDFKNYFMMIKNAGLKTAWKKILKPVPFCTILIIAGLLCAPIGIYAIDAGIPSNDSDEYEGMDLGALGYYVKTDSTWTVGPVFKSYNDTNKSGAMVTWIDYADDAATMGGFDVIVDSKGNGAEAASNIFLSDATDGSSTAAMLIYLIRYTGFNDDVKSKLGMSEDNYTAFCKIIDDLEFKVGGEYKSVRDIVLGDMDKYGILSSDVSDENLRYIFGTSFLTDNYDEYTIANMYSKIASYCGKNISYFMVDGSMFPIYYGYSSSFSTMAYVNGYKLTDSYGTVGQFLNVDYYTYYYGLYGYTDAMYNTLIWRAYIGLSPYEAGYTSSAEYISALMKSDGSVKAHPGYGLSNFEADYDHWYVMYSSDPDADPSSTDGWTRMLYADATAEQEANGGVINYLSGLPACLKFVPNSSGKLLSGTVDSAGSGLKGVRVSVVDSEGTVRSTTTTDDDGSFNILVTGTGSQIKYYSGSENLTDGILIKTVAYTEGMSGNLTVDSTTSGEGIFVDSEGNDQSETIYNIFNDGDGLTKGMKLTGKTSGREYYATITNTPSYKFTWTDIVPDVYTVTLTKGSTSYVTSAEITSYTGANYGVKVTLESKEITFNITDGVGTKLAGTHEVTVVDMDNPGVTYLKDSEDGVLTVTLVNGNYKLVFSDYVTTMSPFTVSSDSSTTYDVTVHDPLPIGDTTFTGFDGYGIATIYSTGYQISQAVDGGTVAVRLPTGAGAAVTYTAYATNGTTCKMAKTGSLAAVEGSYKVTGTMKDPSEKEVSGTILFISDDGYQVPVSVMSDGSYSVVLIGGNYTVYAKSGTDVSISRLELTSSTEKNIDLVEGKMISGSTTWQSSTNKLPFVPITVSNITGCDGCSFVVVTESNGTYMFYIPEDATCEMTARLSGTSPFYFGTSSERADYKTETGVDGSKSFQAKVDSATVKNELGYRVKVESTTIDNGATKTVSLSGPTLSVTLDDEIRYAKGSFSISPWGLDVVLGPTHIEEDDIFGDSTMYYICDVTVSNGTDVVTITATDEEAGDKVVKSDSGIARTYYLEENKNFQMTVRNSDSTKVMITNIHANAKIDINATTLSDAATITGFVGYNKSGDMTLNYLAQDYTFSISSGRYSILVPIGGTFTLLPTITDEQDDVSYTYSLYEAGVATPFAVDASSWTAGTTYTYNLAVTSKVGDGTHTITATEDAIVSMTDAAISDVVFKTKFVNSSPEGVMTYRLSGGTAWNNLAFYEDEGCTVPITTISFSGTSGFVYGKGTIVRDSIAFSSDYLTVTLTDINGKVACTSKITGGVDQWKFTEPTESSTNVSITNNSVGDSEYKYAIKVVNDDNFTKRFTFVPTGIDSSWYVTYVYGNEINNTGIIDVKGYTTMNVYVKITSKNGTSEDELDIPDITTTVTVTDPAGKKTISSISTDSSEEVTVSGNTATANSKSTITTVSVDEYTATGRDVLDSRSDMPVYIWIGIAIIVALVFITIWAASKRGVFTRKK